MPCPFDFWYAVGDLLTTAAVRTLQYDEDHKNQGRINVRVHNLVLGVCDCTKPAGCSQISKVKASFVQYLRYH
jgi:hypothetical protein